MAASISSLCAVLLCAIWEGKPQARNASGGRADLVPTSIAVVSVLTILGWSTYLDLRSGEGTVDLVFIMFFGPAIVLSYVAARRLISSQAARGPRILVVAAIGAVSLAMILFYEPSDSGAPNLLAIPLLIVQVGLFWLASHLFGRVAAGKDPAKASTV